MNCQTARDVFPELLDRRTAPESFADARAHLVGCPDCQHEFATLSATARALDTLPSPRPSLHLRQNFYALLQEEKRSAAQAPARETRPSQHSGRPSFNGTGWRWVVSSLAGCALLALGFFAGTRFTPPAPMADEATKRELAALRTELKKMTQVFGYTLLQQQQGPATDRMREVLASANTEKPNDRILDDLISALAFDPSANIRLRALEALYPHAERAMVRAGVLAALPREQNPLVQLEMIDFVAAARDHAAAPILQTISQNEQAERTVRDAAQRALAQL